MKCKIKAAFLFLSFYLFSGYVFAQTEVTKYVFLGFGIDEKVPGCVNNPSTRQESHWLPADKIFSVAYDSIKAAVKARYLGRFTRISQFTVKVGQPRVIGLIEKTWKCGGKNLTFLDGKDEAEVMAKAEADKKMYSEIVSYRQLSLINCQAEIAKLENRAFVATGLSWDKATLANYEGISAKYLYAVKPANSFTLARFTNTNTNTQVIAKIVITLPNGKTITEKLESSWSITRKIEATSFKVEVTYLPYTPGDTSEGVIEWTKKKVQDYLIEKDGKIKTNSSAIGVRG